VLPFEASQEQRSLADGALAKTSDLLEQVKPSGWRFSVIPSSESVRRNVKSPSQACRELGASHVLRGEFQRNGGTVALRAVVADACSQQTVKEFALEYAAGDEARMPLALAGSVTGSLHLPPVRLTETVNASALAYYTAGVGQLQQEAQVDDAIGSLERATALDPQSPLAWAALAEAYYLKSTLTSEARYLDLAVGAARRAESLNPDAAPVCRIAGILRMESGKYAQAVGDFRRAIELDPSDPNAYTGLARAQHALGQDQEVIQALLKAIEVGPRYFKAYRQLGGVYYDLGDFTKAAEQFRKVVDLIPNMPEGHFSLAVCYVKLGRYTEAELELKAALRLREDWNSLVSLGATLAYKGRYMEAIEYYKKAIALAPQRYLAWVNIGDNYRRTNQRAQATDAYEQALRLARRDVLQNPQAASARAFTAYLLAQLGNSEQAEYEIGQSLGSPSKDAQLLRVAALTYEALGKRGKTISVLKDAPWSVLDDLSRQPDMAGLRGDPRFLEVLGKKAQQK
jgi:tetratricopeptide (TPR) repeat protein